MGREIRRVPPNWEHPRYSSETTSDRQLWEKFIPLYDRDFEEELTEWFDGYTQWKTGTHPDYDATHEYWEYSGPPPRPDDFRPKFKEQATWWQVYETVSEGTPISPPFATAEKLIAWLTTEVDFWGYGPQTRKAAENFVRGGWAPSAVLVGGVFYSGIEACDISEKEPH